MKLKEYVLLVMYVPFLGLEDCNTFLHIFITRNIEHNSLSCIPIHRLFNSTPKFASKAQQIFQSLQELVEFLYPKALHRTLNVRFMFQPNS